MTALTTGSHTLDFNEMELYSTLAPFFSRPAFKLTALFSLSLLSF
jgi:hypothetical protein